MEALLSEVRSYYPKGSYVIHVCKSESGDLQGWIHFPNAARKSVFFTLWGMLRQMETDIDRNQYPQHTFELRRWDRKQNTRKQKEEKLKSNARLGEPICSFLVLVQYCRNATWQGSVLWMEGKQTQSFRSEYELLKLIEEAAGSNHKTAHSDAR